MEDQAIAADLAKAASGDCADRIQWTAEGADRNLFGFAELAVVASALDVVAIAERGADPIADVRAGAASLAVDLTLGGFAWEIQNAIQTCRNQLSAAEGLTSTASHTLSQPKTEHDLAYMLDQQYNVPDGQIGITQVGQNEVLVTLTGLDPFGDPPARTACSER